MILILQPLALIDVSICIVHLSPATPLVLAPLPLVHWWVFVKVCAIPLRSRTSTSLTIHTDMSCSVHVKHYGRYIHASFHLSIHHSTSSHTSLILGVKCCRYHTRHVFRISTLHYKWHQTSSKPDVPCLIKINKQTSKHDSCTTLNLSGVEWKLTTNYISPCFLLFCHSPVYSFPLAEKTVCRSPHFCDLMSSSVDNGGLVGGLLRNDIASCSLMKPVSIRMKLKKQIHVCCLSAIKN